MGIKTIMNSREIIIIASGYNKAKAIEGSIETSFTYVSRFCFTKSSKSLFRY